MARTGLIYGDTNTYKSTAVGHFSKYIYEKTHKRTLLLTTDGGGLDPIEGEIRGGLLVPHRCNVQVPLPFLYKIAEGYWPEHPEDSSSHTNLIPTNWDEYGGLAIEGLSSVSQTVLRYLADNGVKTGEDATNQFGLNVWVNGRETMVKFAGNSRGHYGFTQNHLYSLVMKFASWPVEYVLWTAHSSKSEEEDRTPIYGPDVAGKKATAKVPTWVGHCIHAQDYMVRKPVEVPDPADPKKKMVVDEIENVVRMYFMKHPDPVTNILYPANPRVVSAKLPDLLKKYPGGYFVPTLEGGFDEFLHTVDKLQSEQGNAMDEWRKKVDERFRGKQAVGGQAGQVGQAGQQAVRPESVPVLTSTATK